MGEPSTSSTLFIGAADEHRAAALVRLRDLVESESPSGAVALLGVVAQKLRTRWEELGLAVSTIPGRNGDHLVGRYVPRGQAPTGHLLVLAHYDTVWAEGELGMQPFTVEGDRVSGPGTYDMKGGIVAFELAVELLREAGIEPSRECRIVCIADEEVSSADGRRVVLEEAVGAVAALGLEPPHPGGDFKSARRGVARVALRVTGRAAHAGLEATKGVSAIDELVDQLTQLRDVMPDVKDAAINVGTISGGTRANVVAAEAEAEIGLRFATSATEDVLLRAVSSLRPIRDGARLDVSVISHRPAWGVSSTNWLSDYVVSLAAVRNEPVAARPAGGAGDTNFTGAAGVPSLDGLGPRGANAHAKGEYLEISSMLTRAELLAALLANPLPV